MHVIVVSSVRLTTWYPRRWSLRSPTALEVWDDVTRLGASPVIACLFKPPPDVSSRPPRGLQVKFGEHTDISCCAGPFSS